MEEKLNAIQSLIGVLNSPIAQRKGVTISPEHCKIWVEELSKFMQESGWHPGSELPPKSTRIIVCYKDKDFYDLYTSQPSFLTKDNEYIGVPEYAQKTLMWCYPPKED